MRMADGYGVITITPYWNATQMAPERRGAGMALFASVYFIGQAIGVAAAGALAERMGAVSVVIAGAVCVVPIGLNFARLRARRR